MADDTIQQVYMRVTQKMQDCQKQLAQIEAQMSTNQRETRLAALTRREIQDLDNSVPLYKSMGKMFIQESKEDLLKDIEKSASDAKILIDALEKKQKFVKRDLDEATGNLRDIIHSAQSSSKK
ncbi:hypothetical protein IW146_001890 [Coemansia sp. RSA 922]|nr:hypothetical protein LPJ71_006232 [Coemansia sp. S17]KAJ2042849.1 hypothetical protein H4S04_007082 [Coemansia sp. S16]KAJ2076153.1 hypothetical protein GGH13_000086 [Coemansia sp. S155-1]KAJ2115975.1 hypothetical protein IW146_001890 [Coemansia sp. RSA 922]